MTKKLSKTSLIKKKFQSDVTLDIGSGSINFGKVVRCIGDVNVDIGKPATKPTKPFVRCDASALPFQDNSFAQVTMFDVIEHLDSPTNVLKEIRRIVADNGRVILGTPNMMYVLNPLYMLLHGFYVPHKDHVNIWSRFEISNLIKRAGFSKFKVIACTYEDTTHSLLARLAIACCFFRDDLSGRQLIAIIEK